MQNNQMVSIYAVIRWVMVIILIPSFLLFLLLPAYVLAFQNEPKNFRGLKWGNGPEVQKDLILYRKDGRVAIYTRKNDQMEIGGVRGIKSIYYYFYNNKFFKVIINLQEEDGLRHFDRLADVFNSLYGKPREERIRKGDPFTGKPIEMTKFWRGSTVNLDLFGLIGFPTILQSYPDGCDTTYGRAISTVFCASYQYKPITAEHNRYLKKRTRTPEGKGR